MDVVEVALDKASIGKAFKKNAKTVTDYVSKMKDDEIELLEKALQDDG